MSTLKQQTQENWQLSHYEQNRLPQPLIQNDEVATSHGLLPHFKCPICLQVLKQTMASRCLHRFCRQCITAQLAQGRKECPTCGDKIIAFRALRADHNFDQLISKLCLNLSKAKSDFNESTFSDETSNKIFISGDLLNEIDLIIRPIQIGVNGTITKPLYLKTSHEATVDHIIKYLDMRQSIEARKCDKSLDKNNELNAQESKKLIIYQQTTNGEFKQIRLSTKLADLVKTKPDNWSPLELFYFN